MAGVWGGWRGKAVVADIWIQRAKMPYKGRRENTPGYSDNSCVIAGEE